MLIIMAGTFLVGTPVNLSDDDGVGVDHGHLIVEVRDLGLWVGVTVAAAVPASVVVYGIADVVALDGP